MASPKVNTGGGGLEVEGIKGLAEEKQHNMTLDTGICAQKALDLTRLLASLISTLPCDPNTCSLPVISSTSGFPKESSHLSLYMQSLCLTRSPPLPLSLLPFKLSTQSKDTSFGS